MAITFSSISNPEFIDLKPLDLNPLMSSCKIKVLYVGKNRNGSFISKEVATEMSKTLRGSPIVGWYREETDDFRDHGHSMTLEDGEIRFKTNTTPYGFVSPDANVWFEMFEEVDDFGNKVEREYLVTTGYLWTGQFPECKRVTDEGRPHSMELDEASLKGKWSEDTKTGMEFFIINDATFSKLCILGKDVEPCFEGSEITSYSRDDKESQFTHTLFTMMQELKEIIKGGTEMELENQVTPVDNAEQTAASEFENNTETQQEDMSSAQVESESTGEEFACSDDDKKKDKDKYKKSEDDKEEDKGEPEEKDDKGDDEKSDDAEDDKEKDKKKYQLLEEQYEALKADYAALKETCDKLQEFAKSIEEAKKDEMIASFTMLTDEDKADVVAHKSEYTLDEIEAKLCVIGKHKGVNFSTETKEEPEEQPLTTFNLGDSTAVPDWVKALRATKEEKRFLI